MWMGLPIFLHHPGLPSTNFFTIPSPFILKCSAITVYVVSIAKNLKVKVKVTLQQATKGLERE
jgi:hypothetical protein